MIPQLIKLEYLKFRKNPVIGFLVLFFILLTPLASLISSEFAQFQKNLPMDAGNIMAFPDIWDWMGYMGSWLGFFFLGVISIYIVSTEISYKTMRQGIINGQNRKEYYLAKISSIIFIAILATFYYIIWTLVFGIINTDDIQMTAIFDNNWAIGRYFLMTITYMIFAFFLAIIVKKSGLAVFLYLTYVMAIESLLRWGVHKKVLGTEFMNFYPMNAAEDLMPMPLYRLAEKLPDGDLGFELLNYSQAATCCILFSALFLFCSYYIFMRRDM